MSEMFNPHAPATAYYHNTTIVAVLELSGKNWLFGAIAPGVKTRAKRSFAARDIAGSLEEIRRWIRDFTEARDWGQFHSPKNLVMALSVEAAELLVHFQGL